MGLFYGRSFNFYLELSKATKNLLTPIKRRTAVVKCKRGMPSNNRFSGSRFIKNPECKMLTAIFEMNANKRKRMLLLNFLSISEIILNKK